MIATKTHRPHRMVRDAILRTVAMDALAEASIAPASPALPGPAASVASPPPTASAARPEPTFPAAVEPSAAAPAPPRPSKIALVVDLLTRPQGATLDQMVTATGWLPHSTRAAPTVLRQKGHTLSSEKHRDGARTYRITAPSMEATA